MLERVRSLMVRQGLQALLVPTSDPHNSEYIHTAFERRAVLCNFHGSAGTCVVTLSKAAMWTDGRYWLEAAETLNPGWELMKDGLAETPKISKWLADNNVRTVATDPFTCTVSAWEELAKEMELLPTELNVVDEAWGAERPNLPSNEVFVMPEAFSGMSTQSKIAAVCAQCEEAACDLCLLSALDDVAWLFNLRGSDVPYNPVFHAYAIVNARSRGAVLFVDLQKMKSCASSLPECVRIAPYDGLAAYLSEAEPNLTCAVDPAQISFGLKSLLAKKGVKPKTTKGIVKALKAVKNDVELNGFRRCHERDGAALTRFLAWLDNQVRVKGASVTECEAADVLEKYRKQNENFVQLSFPTISASGANGAIIHYHPGSARAPSVISMSELYLVDSGAQYWDGTTDVTRTVCFAAPKAFEIEAYTLVLKGHIALETTIFPKNTIGNRIDSIARLALWSRGLDFMHGVGHGVGHFLNVHEGPQSISFRTGAASAPLEARMIVSNEPGYYKEGAFGIRIEGMEVVVAAKTAHGGDNFLTFEPLTVAPLCPELIDVGLLTEGELAWVNAYHARVLATLAPLIHEDTLALEYLTKVTQPLHRARAT